MCGIVGYAGRGGAAGEIFECLKKLEYRGYDSAGISTADRGEIFTFKRSGRVQCLSEGIKSLPGSVGIGHTRWATHGAATDANAHPHVSGAFSVVHNGMIENYAELKSELAASGRKFLSQTDSEVIAHLLDYYYDGDLADAVRLTCARLKGCWAIAVLCTHFDGFAVACRGMPVILGRGDANYAASDVNALAGRARERCILGDGCMALVTPRGMQVLDGALAPVKPVFGALDAEEEGDGGQDCAHYMLREIRCNARTMRRTCAAFLSSGGGAELYSRLASADMIVLVGCGTAYNAALAGARLLGGAYDCPVTARLAGEAKCDPPRVTRRSVCIAVSQSGETADTIAAAGILRAAGAYVIAMTNVGYSAITRLADRVLPVCAGPEICVAATKSYIGQLACFHMLASPSCAALRSKCICAVADDVEKLALDGEYALVIARLCVNSRAVFFLGRGADVDVAVEGSLKLKEVSYVFSDGLSAAELKHGTLALVDEGVLSVVLVTDAALADKCKNAVEQVLSRRGRVAVVTTLADVHAELCGRVDASWLLPAAPAHLAHFVAATALQLIAYRAALLAGHDPDKPRNLAKSVTVE